LVYRTVAGMDLSLDVYFPPFPQTARSNRPLRSALLYIHGGGWQGGDKRSGDVKLFFPQLLRRGFIVASANYRHAPEHRHPAQFDDVRAALDFLRRSRGEFGIDPERLGVWGASAGGHLAALLALAPADAFAGVAGRGTSIETTQEPTPRSETVESSSHTAVRAAAVLYGPTDLTSDDLPERTRGIIRTVFGDDPDVLRRASPMAHIRPGGPPMLLIHGERDQSIPLSQSERFQSALEAAGCPVRLLTVLHAGHVFRPVDRPIAPTYQEIGQLLADFFESQLGLP
jgi:acetyl esterase/lipase